MIKEPNEETRKVLEAIDKWYTENDVDDIFFPHEEIGIEAFYHIEALMKTIRVPVNNTLEILKKKKGRNN